MITFWTALYNLLNTNLFVGLSTVLTIGWAIWLYSRQRKESKQQIARLLVNEIRNAEEALQFLKDRQVSMDLPSVIILPQNSWNKYSHLFTKNFDQDEIHRINRFYSDAERANYIIGSGNEMELFLLQVKERSDAIQHKIMDILNDSPSQAQVKIRMTKFTNHLSMPESLYHYSPQGFNAKLDAYLREIAFILDTPAGIKLKRLAGLEI